MTKTRPLAVLFAGSFALLVPELAAQALQRLTFADTQQRILWAGPVPAVAWAADGVLGRGQGRHLVEPRDWRHEGGARADRCRGSHGAEVRARAPRRSLAR